MITVAEAIQIIRTAIAPLPAESVALNDCLGRVLAEDIVADSDLPPFDRAQMDGYALFAEDVVEAPVKLEIVGESAAGRGWHQELQRGQAVRIMTGAPVPQNADSVQQVELTHESSDGKVVEILQPVEPGRSVVKRGAEIRQHETVLKSGEEISAAMIAVLASFGYHHVKVSRPPRVAVLATGSELVRVDEKPQQDQIRDSNNHSLSAYARLAGAVVETLPLAGDNTDLLRSQIARAATHSDVVITSGGVSMGVYDFTKAALIELEAEIYFERVALRPGKPTVFARLPHGALIFGLPGNPVSVSVTFNLFARTALKAMQSATSVQVERHTALLAREVKGAKDRESYLPCTFRTDDEGHLVAEPLKWGGSSDFVGFAKATGLVIVQAGVKVLNAGTAAQVVKLPG